MMIYFLISEILQLSITISSQLFVSLAVISFRKKSTRKVPFHMKMIATKVLMPNPNPNQNTHSNLWTHQNIQIILLYIMAI